MSRLRDHVKVQHLMMLQKSATRPLVPDPAKVQDWNRLTVGSLPFSLQLDNILSELMLVNWIGVENPVAKKASYPGEAPDLLAIFKVNMMLVNQIGVEKKG